MNINLPRGFQITGPIYYLIAIAHDLKSMGYNMVLPKGNDNTIKSLDPIAQTKEQHKVLTCRYIYEPHSMDLNAREQFVLPRDLQAALKYASDTLNDSRWEQNLKLNELVHGRWYVWMQKKGTSKTFFQFDCISDRKGHGKSTIAFKVKEFYHPNETAMVLNETTEFYLRPENFVREATKQEIQAAIIKIAEQKGFKEGVFFYSAGSANLPKFPMIGKPSFYTNGYLYGENFSGCIYDGDDWAIIAPDTINLKLSNGVTLEIEAKTHIKYDNTEINIQEICDLYAYLDYGYINSLPQIGSWNTNLAETNINIGCQKNFTKQDLKLIIDAYFSK